MKEFNLRRLMDSCCVEIDEDLYDALFDYLIETDVDLNELNVDDLVANIWQTYNEDEFDNFDKDKYYEITRTENTIWYFA